MAPRRRSLASKPVAAVSPVVQPSKNPLGSLLDPKPGRERRPLGPRECEARVIASAGILGLGFSVPNLVRTNDDPVFAAIDPRASALRDIFSGTRERRVLARDESLTELMAAAARGALEQAGSLPGEVDRLLGYESVSEFITPNGLYLLHRLLGLPPHAMVLPLNCDFSNFVLGVAMAAEAIAAGRSTRALVVCGSNWTRFVDYRRTHTLVAGDGAGAALVGPSERLSVVDYAVETVSRGFDIWTMKARTSEGPGGRYLLVGEDGLPIPTYELSPTAGPEFIQDGITIPVRLSLELLRKHGVKPADVTLVPHQTKMLMDRWAEAISPGAVLHTFEQFGNMSHASVPVTLAMRMAEIRTPYVLLIAAGTGSHFAVMLLRT